MEKWCENWTPFQLIYSVKKKRPPGNIQKLLMRAYTVHLFSDCLIHFLTARLVILLVYGSVAEIEIKKV